MTETEGFASEPEPVLFPELGDPPAPDESLVTVRRDDLRRILTQSRAGAFGPQTDRRSGPAGRSGAGWPRGRRGGRPA